MSRYRSELPQLAGGFFLVDGGIETDLIFNHGIRIRGFATHTLLADASGREAVVDYFRPYLSLADEVGAGFILTARPRRLTPTGPPTLAATKRSCVGPTRTPSLSSPSCAVSSPPTSSRSSSTPSSACVATAIRHHRASSRMTPRRTTRIGSAGWRQPRSTW